MLLFIKGMAKKTFRMALALPLFVGHATNASAFEHFQKYTFKVEDNRLDLEVWNDSNRLTVKEIQDNIHRFQKAEDLFEYISTRSPLLMEQFMFIAESGSLQPSTPEKPRVILFGDGLFIAAGANGKSVEIIELDPKTFEHSFHRIHFNETVSMENNPAVCANCHGSPARPIWQPYDFWPTALGSHIGRFGTEKEENKYRAIQNSSPRHPLFKYLKFPTVQQGHFLNSETLTQYVQAQAFLRISKEFKSRIKELESIWPATLGVLARCGKANTKDGIYENFKRFIPQHLQSSFKDRLDTVYADTKLERSRLKRYQQGRYDDLYGNSRELFPILHDRLIEEIRFVAPLRVLLEQKDVDLRDYVTNQGANPFFFQTPANFLNDLLLALFRANPESIDAFNPRIDHMFDMQWAYFDCNQLAEASRIALAEEQEFKNNLSTNSMERATMLGECIQCHNTLKLGPDIPFDDTNAFSTWLSNEDNFSKIVERIETTGIGRMPPTRVLTEEERTSLLELIAELRDVEL